MPIVQINPFSESTKKIAIMYPEQIINHLEDPEIIDIGYVKTTEIELIVIKKHDDLYAFYTPAGKEICSMIAKTSKRCGFYLVDDKQIIFDCIPARLFYSSGSPVTCFVNTSFKANIFGIQELHEFNYQLYYKNHVMASYRTHVVSYDDKFYRICYNKEKFIIFRHDINYIAGGPRVCYCEQIVVGGELNHMFTGDLKEKFPELIKFIILDKFTNLEDALIYVKFITKLDVINDDKNKIPIDTIREIIASGAITKEKLNVFAKMFV